MNFSFFVTTVWLCLRRVVSPSDSYGTTNKEKEAVKASFSVCLDYSIYLNMRFAKPPSDVSR